MVHYLTSFIVLLTPLVFVHELGHFLFARLFGVRVDVFSIGFGPKIIKHKRGETEYCFSAIPLGGYVKILGQDPHEEVAASDRHRAYFSKEPWKRFFILLGGPLFNFLFAIMVFSVMLMLGEPHVGTKVARVIPGTQAEVVGFRVGDVITAVNDTVVTRFEEVEEIVSNSPNIPLIIRVRRESVGHRDIRVTPQLTDGFSIYGEPIKVGEIEGLEVMGRFPVVAVPNPGSAAAKAGIKSGDVVIQVMGKTVTSYEQIEAAVQQALSQDVKFLEFVVEPRTFVQWIGAKEPPAPSGVARLVKLPAQALERLGIYSSELMVSGVLPNSPSQKAGITEGDLLLSINGTQLKSFHQLRAEVQKVGATKKQANLAIMREGKTVSVELEPTVNESKDPITGQTVQSFAIGVYPLLVASEPDMVTERIFNPITLTAVSWSRALDLSAKTLVSIKKLFTRQVSMGTIGGPLLIGKLAGDSLSRGLISFLKVMALISISLAIFNILPVPVLDGGHIVLLGIEALRGKPLGTKQTELIQQVGMSLIMLLLVVVLFNDISRVAVPAIQNALR
jgi:regulator of sigma E protease